MTPADGAAFRFSNWLGSGDVGLGMVGAPRSLDDTLYFQSSWLAPADRPSPDIDLGLSEAWDIDGGLFLLLGTLSSDWQAFADAVRARRPDSCAFVWIANADRPPDEWAIEFLQTHRDGARFVLDEPADLPLSADPDGYRLRLDAGCAIGASPAGSGIGIQGGGAGSAIAFGRGAERLPLDGGLTVDFTSDFGLRLNGRFTVPGGTPQADWFDALDIGLRLSCPAPVPGGDPATVTSVRFPVVAPSAGVPAFVTSLWLAPGRLTDPEASYLEPVLTGDLTLPTWYRTLSGKPILLHPTTLRFVFASVLDVPAPGRADGLTLMPDGLFELSVGTFGSRSRRAAGARSAAEAGPLDDSLPDAFACGAAGTEAITLPPGQPADPVALFEFVAGRPGFAPGAAAAQAGTALTDRTRTSWVRLYLKGGTLKYLSQPPGDAAMYTPDPGGGSGAVTLLGYLPMQAATLVAGGDPGLATFPMVPLAAVEPARVAAALELEVAAVAPTRKAQLGVMPSGRARALRSDDAETFTAVTPRGLECLFERADPAADAVWKETILAKLLPPPAAARRARPDDGASDFAGGFSLQDIGGPLESALLASQQCLVISDSASMTTHLVDHTSVTLSGWTFHLAPDAAHWDRYGTIVIVKNADAPLGQLALDVGSWTNATDFNRDPEATRRRLAAIFDDAREAYRHESDRAGRDAEPAQGEQSDLQYFVETVLDSPSWNGYLFLNVAVDVPDQLGGLRGGIEMDRFFAHHLGVTQRVFTSIEALATTSSALFGLVAYAGPATPLASGSEYRFRVGQLGLTFRNSMLTRFQAVLEVYLATLFGKRPRAESDDEAVLVLDGTRQRRGEQDLYMFALRESRAFRFDRGPLRTLGITQAEFDTYSVEPVPPPGIDPPVRRIASRFSFVGGLELAATQRIQDAFDVLSFETLGFSALRLDMSFLDDGAPPRLTFAFDIGAMQLEAGRSTARPGSLFAGFPLKLGRIIGGADGAAPGGQGYMNVVQPVPVASLGRDWYGVVLVLDLGALSDVAGSMGVEASLLTAWGAGDDEILLGLKLPGSSGPSASLSLLGVLQATIHALSMRGGPHEGYALMMNGIRLKAFGKTMPSSGSFEFYLFGNPDPAVDQSSLGWYGAYKRDAEKKDPAGPGARGLRSASDARRLAPPAPGAVKHNRFPSPVPRGATTRHNDKGS